MSRKECLGLTSLSRAPLFILGGFLLASMPAMAQSNDELRQPFAALRDAYRSKDPARAAEAYTEDAKLILQYPGMPPQEYVGATTIRQTIEQILTPIKPEWTLAMNFKLDPAAAQSSTRTGLYRIIVNMGHKATSNYGRFTVTLRAEKGAWRFSEDISDFATEADYDALREPEMFMD